MRLLLDTHIFLWMISGDDFVPKSFKEAIRDPANPAFLSVASNWEIFIKNKLGKLPLPGAPEQFIPEQRRLHKIKSLPITESSLFHLSALPNLHKDPFDRLLISQAKDANLTIVTADPAILDYDVPVLSIK